MTVQQCDGAEKRRNSDCPTLVGSTLRRYYRLAKNSYYEMSGKSITMKLFKCELQTIRRNHNGRLIERVKRRFTFLLDLLLEILGR